MAVKRPKTTKATTLSEGQELYGFTYPGDRRTRLGYSFIARKRYYNAKVETVSPDGKFAVIRARLFSGGMHTLRVKISEMEILSL